MENCLETEQSPMIAELVRAREQLNHLVGHLNHHSLVDICKSLAPTILSSVETALFVAQSNELRRPRGTSSGGSPRGSENSGRTPKSRNNSRPVSKKRKTSPNWTSHVRLSSEEGVNAPVEDGYNWRKYGQKEILGAKFPRAYYRCTHRNTRGCLAIKQVQRSDDDTSVFDVTYLGTHTCHQQPHVLEPIELGDHHHHHHDNQLLLSFKTGLKVETKTSASGTDSFSFPSTPVSCPLTVPTAENRCFAGVNASPPFVSPATSESNYLVDLVNGYGGGESDFREYISGANSADSHMLEMDFIIDDPLEFESDFHFGGANFFP